MSGGSKAEASCGGWLCTWQLYVQPHLDLRFITTYMCNGSEVVCSSFPRRYSRRYLPMGSYGACSHLLNGLETTEYWNDKEQSKPNHRVRILSNLKN